MDIMTRRMRTAMIAAASVALLVTGCASGGGAGGSLDGNPEEPVGPTEVPIPDESSLPIDEGPDFEPSVAWIDEGSSIELTTWGSSSCPAEVAEVLLDAPDRVTLQLAPPSDGACTMDMARNTQAVELPEGADGRPLGVALRSGDGSVSAELTLD